MRRNPRKCWCHRAGVISLASLLAAAGCIQNGFVGPKVDPPPEVRACDDGAPQDAAVDLTGQCTLPATDWDLAVKWSYQAPGRWLWSAHVARFEDSDDDSLITERDRVGILLVDGGWNDEESAPRLISGVGSLMSLDEDLDPWGWAAAVGDVDPVRPGAEAVLAGYTRDTYSWDIALGLPGDLVYLRSLDVDDDVGMPELFLADVLGDGSPDLLGIGGVVSAADGATLFRLPWYGGGVSRVLAADLDLDGAPEILTQDDGGNPAVLDGSGQVRAVCPIRGGAVANDGNMVFAIGNLDDDPQGEFAVARPGILAICEADGTVDAQIVTQSTQSWTLALADLDGDGAPEVVVDQTGDLETGFSSVAAYDRDLNPLWVYPLSTVNQTANVSAADLDGDGRHEIVVCRQTGDLLILDPEGHELASARGPAEATVNPPIIADLDNDGLAEILLSGTSPTLMVFTNTSGGWPVAGAEDPWPGIDHFPGDRRLDGTLPDAADVQWLVSGHNVWQGTAAGPPDLPDLGVEITDACSNDCENTVLTVYVSNGGAVASPVPITVELFGVDDGVPLGTQVMEPPPPGIRRPVQFTVPTASTGAGVRATVDAGWAECTDLPNEATFTDVPCF